MGRVDSRARPVGRSLVVVAHPDDEILGAGIWMYRNRHTEIYVLHLTNGSSRDMLDASRLGFGSPESYAAERRGELEQALARIPIPADRCFCWNTPDKEAYLHLDGLVTDTSVLVEELNPDLVITHAYEGGHPDHDSAAFIMTTVRKRGIRFDLREFPLYHAAHGEASFGAFLDHSDEVESLQFTPDERTLKRAMLECFKTQRQMLDNFQVDREVFRGTSGGDFTQPPHAGPLLYESWGFNVTGAEWRAHAEEASHRSLRTTGQRGGPG